MFLQLASWLFSRSRLRGLWCECLDFFEESSLAPHGVHSVAVMEHGPDVQGCDQQGQTKFDLVGHILAQLLWQPSTPKVTVLPVKKIHHPKYQGKYNADLDDYEAPHAPKADPEPAGQDQVWWSKRDIQDNGQAIPPGEAVPGGVQPKGCREPPFEVEESEPRDEHEWALLAAARAPTRPRLQDERNLIARSGAQCASVQRPSKRFFDIVWTEEPFRWHTKCPTSDNCERHKAMSTKNNEQHVFQHVILILYIWCPVNQSISLRRIYHSWGTK